MLASLDRAAIQMRLEGMRLIGERLRMIKGVKARINGHCKDPAGCILGKDEIVGMENRQRFERYGMDPLKLIIAARSEAAASTFANMLIAQKLQYEKKSTTCLEFLVTIGTFRDHLEHLVEIVRLATSKDNDLLGMPPTLRGSSQSESAMRVDLAALPRYAALGTAELV